MKIKRETWKYFGKKYNGFNLCYIDISQYKLRSIES